MKENKITLQKLKMIYDDLIKEAEKRGYSELDIKLIKMWKIESQCGFHHCDDIMRKFPGLIESIPDRGY